MMKLNTVLEKYNINFNLRDFNEEEKKDIFRYAYRTSSCFPGEYFHSLNGLGDRIMADLNVQTMYDHAYDLPTEQIGWSEDGYLDLEESLTWNEIKVIISDFCKECEQEFIRCNTDLVYKHI